MRSWEDIKSTQCISFMFLRIPWNPKCKSA